MNYPFLRIRNGQVVLPPQHHSESIVDYIKSNKALLLAEHDKLRKEINGLKKELDYPILKRDDKSFVELIEYRDTLVAERVRINTWKYISDRINLPFSLRYSTGAKGDIKVKTTIDGEKFVQADIPKTFMAKHKIVCQRVQEEIGVRPKKSEKVRCLFCRSLEFIQKNEIEGWMTYTCKRCRKNCYMRVS